MSFPFYIARRYLFSKKSHNTINFITTISIGGVTLATLALVCTLSVFSGFQDLVATLFTAFDPELKIVPAKGKFAPADHPVLTRIKRLEEVAVAAECLEDHALAQYGGKQAMITLRGVSDNYNRCIDVDSILYGDRPFVLAADVLNYAVMGLQLASDLGCSLNAQNPVSLFAPRRGERINPANPAAGFNRDELFPAGIVFAVGQKKYDANYLLAPIRFTRALFEQQGMVSSVDLRLKSGVDPAAAKAKMQKLAGSDFLVKDRYEQQEEVFRIMNIEKLVAYVFLTFILLIACFNIIGSLSMLIIDKKDDIETLRHLGATDRQIRQIFLFEGRFIATIGAILGVALGLGLCYLQSRFGFLKLGNSSGDFLTNAYPVSVRAFDVCLAFVTVLIVGYLSVWYPVRYFSRRLLAHS